MISSQSWLEFNELNLTCVLQNVLFQQKLSLIVYIQSFSDIATTLKPTKQKQSRKAW